MKKSITIIILLHCFCSFVAQNNAISKSKSDSVFKSMSKQEKDKVIEDILKHGQDEGAYTDVFFKSKEKKNTYENQGRNHSAYFQLNKDSTFLYYRIFESGFHMTLGKYSKNKNTLTFDWDSLKTYYAVKDYKFYHYYFKYSTPTPHKIKHKSYTGYPENLKPAMK